MYINLALRNCEKCYDCIDFGLNTSKLKTNGTDISKLKTKSSLLSSNHAIECTPGLSGVRTFAAFPSEDWEIFCPFLQQTLLKTT